MDNEGIEDNLMNYLRKESFAKKHVMRETLAGLID